MSGKERGLQGLAYDNKGTVHIIPSNSEMWVDAYFGERKPAICGAGFGTEGGFHPVNGLRLSEEAQKGAVCETCVERLREEGTTIPGFVVDGEPVGEYQRYLHTGDEQ